MDPPLLNYNYKKQNPTAKHQKKFSFYLLATLLTVSLPHPLKHNSTSIRTPKTNPMPLMIPFQLTNIRPAYRHLTPGPRRLIRRPNALLPRQTLLLLRLLLVQLGAGAGDPGDVIGAGQPRVPLSHPVQIVIGIGCDRSRRELGLVLGLIEV